MCNSSSAVHIAKKSLIICRLSGRSLCMCNQFGATNSFANPIIVLLSAQVLSMCLIGDMSCTSCDSVGHCVCKCGPLLCQQNWACCSKLGLQSSMQCPLVGEASDHVQVATGQVTEHVQLVKGHKYTCPVQFCIQLRTCLPHVGEVTEYVQSAIRQVSVHAWATI